MIHNPQASQAHNQQQESLSTPGECMLCHQKQTPLSSNLHIFLNFYHRDPDLLLKLPEMNQD